MDWIAVILAVISSILLWETDYQILKWVIIAAAVVTWYLRRVVNSIQKRAGFIDPQIAKFWAHACVVSFWISVVLSIVGIFKAF